MMVNLETKFFNTNFDHFPRTNYPHFSQFIAWLELTFEKKEKEKETNSLLPSKQKLHALNAFSRSYILVETVDNCHWYSCACNQSLKSRLPTQLRGNEVFVWTDTVAFTSCFPSCFQHASRSQGNRFPRHELEKFSQVRNTPLGERALAVPLIVDQLINDDGNLRRWRGCWKPGAT